MTTNPPLSFSQIALFKRCAHRYWWDYEQRVRRRAASPRLVLGDYLHRLFAAHARREDWRALSAELVERTLADTIFEEEATSIREIGRQADRIMDRFVRHVWEPTFSKWEIVSIEQEFTARLGWGIEVRFVPDLLMSDTEGRLWLIDYKTMKDFPEDLETRLIYDDQINLYLWGLDALGLAPAGALHICVRTRLPRAPEVTQKGRLSRVNIVTDEETVREAVAEYRARGIALDDADVNDYISNMTPHRFFDVVATDRSPAVLQRMAREYAFAYRQIEMSRSADLWPRTFTRGCVECPVRELCIAGLAGDPSVIEDLLSTTFARDGEPRVSRALPAEFIEEEGGE